MTQSSQTRASPSQACLVIFALLLLAGCCTPRNSSFTGLSPQQSRALAQKLVLQRDQELQADLRSAFANHPPKNILILSGGDANGAFGCGVAICVAWVTVGCGLLAAPDPLDDAPDARAGEDGAPDVRDDHVTGRE